MGNIVLQTILCLVLVNQVMLSAIPIWEMLSYEEKMGRLMYLYVHLVERYCRTNPTHDCRRVMTLHGVSHLLNYDEHTLDLLDPDQRDAARIVWQAATKSRYKYPPEKSFTSFSQDTMKSRLGGYEPELPDYYDDGPRKVVVPAPKYLRRMYGKY